MFESAAAGFPALGLPPVLPVLGGRAHDKLGERAQADARLRLVYTDYANSYYGRLAERQLSRRGDSRAGTRRRSPRLRPRRRRCRTSSRIPTEPLIRLLLANGCTTMRSASCGMRSARGAIRARIDATIAWVYNRKGELRRAISLMRRAYPQHLTAGGQQLPPEILQVIFPLVYWDSIRKHSAQHDLDPYLVAALIAQESTFDAGVRSSANAWGLMQLVPSTGRQLARVARPPRFTTASLTNPEINIRLGHAYFSQLV